MAYTVVDFPAEYFDTKLYTGTGATQSITGLNFAPDWVWIKERSASASAHNLNDIVRGAGKALFSNTTDAEYDYGTGTGGNLRSFDSTGFSLGTASQTNANGTTFVSWCWDANGAGVSNTAGSITSTVSANTTAGFSIVSYTGTGANATIGHGLGVAPSMIITKSRGTTNNWGTYHHSLGNTKAVFLNLTDAADTSSVYWNNTSPTSSVFSVGTALGTNPANTMIAYCFAEVKGFSKFGKFISNGSDNGTFTYCGFKPAWVMMKPNVSDGWSHWYIFDNKRDLHNLTDLNLQANISDADNYGGANYAQIDMLSNGFKIRRDSNWGLGGSGTEVIYMAFAENPFVSSTGIPTTAR